MDMSQKSSYEEKFSWEKQCDSLETVTLGGDVGHS